MAKKVKPRSKALKITAHVARMTMGLIFIGSGFVKAIDPWGTAIKVDEYIQIYGLESLRSISMWISIWLSCAELLMGCMLTFKVRIRFVSIFALLSMSSFTVVSLLSATVLPVEDCGCFGAAIRLTPWQTFYKNLLLLPMAFVIWYRYRPDKIFSFKKLELFLATTFFFISMGIGLYCYRHLPLIDFLPYRVGVNLPKAIEDAKKMGVGDVETILVYRNINTGKLREFGINDEQWHDSTKWKWVETKTITEEPTIMPLISEFSLVDADNKDVTMELITAEGVLNMLFVTSLDLSISNRDCFVRLLKFAKEATSRGERVICVTPDTLDSNGCYFGIEGYNIDPTTMKTVLRANTGLFRLRDGVIERKSNCWDL